jgi:beta-N-acetylhexosaminidase
LLRASLLPDEDLVGQILMPSAPMSADPRSVAAIIDEFHLAGVALAGDVQDTRAGGGAAQVRSLTDALQAAAPAPGGRRMPLLIATDQEYGWVTRIRDGVVQLPSAMAFGAAGRPELTRAAWAAAGGDLAAVGINVNLAPCADVVTEPGNTIIGSRSFGSRPDAVAAQVAAAVAGLQSAGVAATLKHFPGHGSTTVDSHRALPVLEQSRQDLESSDLVPFRAGIGAGARLVMSGHLDVRSIDPGVPASFSRTLLVDVLRGGLGFGGVVVSDALDMAPARQWSPGEAAVRAVLAGNDLLLMPASLALARDALLGALRSGRLGRPRLVESVARILALRLEAAGHARPDLVTVDSPHARDAASAVAAASITVLSGPCAGPLVSWPVRVTATASREAQAAALAEELVAAGLPVAAAGGSRVHLVGFGDSARDLVPGAAVTVSLDTPYLLAEADSPVRVATYSSSRVAVRALAAVIAGTAAATGRSPVPVAGLPDSACAP